MKNIFTKNRNSKKRIIEASVYELVANELEIGDIKKGLWTKAKGLSGGDANKTESIYINLRAESIVDETKIINEYIDEVKVKVKVKAKKVNSVHPENETHSIDRLRNLLDELYEDVNFKNITLNEFKSILEPYDQELRERLINTEDSFGSYLIHYTVQSGRLDCTEFLVSQGASTTVTNCFGNTPIKLAEKIQNAKHVKYFTETIKNKSDNIHPISAEIEKSPKVQNIDYKISSRIVKVRGVQFFDVQFNGKIIPVEYISSDYCKINSIVIRGYDAKSASDFKNIMDIELYGSAESEILHEKSSIKPIESELYKPNRKNIQDEVDSHILDKANVKKNIYSEVRNGKTNNNKNSFLSEYRSSNLGERAWVRTIILLVISLAINILGSLLSSSDLVRNASGVSMNVLWGLIIFGVVYAIWVFRYMSRAKSRTKLGHFLFQSWKWITMLAAIGTISNSVTLML